GGSHNNHRHPDEEFDKITHEWAPSRYTRQDASIRQGNLYQSGGCMKRKARAREPASHPVRPSRPRRRRHATRSLDSSPKQSAVAFSDDFFSRLVLPPAPFERVPTDVPPARNTP